MEEFALDPEHAQHGVATVVCQHTHCKQDLKGPHYVDLLCQQRQLTVKDLIETYVPKTGPDPAGIRRQNDERIAGFTKETTNDEIATALRAAAEVGDVLYGDDVVSRISTKTGRTKKALEAALKQQQKTLATEAENAAQAQADAEIAKRMAAAEVKSGTVLRDWPLPHAEYGKFVIEPHYDQIYMARVITNDDGGVDVIPLCTPVAMVARVKFSDGKEGIRWKLATADGEKLLDVVGSDAVRSSGNELIATLRDEGVHFTSDGIRFVKEWALSSSSRATIHVVAKPGWYPQGNGHMYVSPLGEVFVAGNQTPAIELRQGGPIKTRARGGTLDGAKEVAAAVLGSGCDYMKMGLLAGPAGAIVNLAEMDSFVIYFGGETTKGKSTSQKLKASAWGPAKLNAGLFRTAKATANACEVLIEQGDGGGTDLDETKAMTGKEVEELIFTVSGGKGKDRQNKNGNTNREAKTWRGTCVSLSGELGVVQKIESEGRGMAGGTAARTLIVNVGDGVTLSRETMRKIEACETHFGWAGPAVVEQLIAQGYAEEPHKLAEEIALLARDLVGEHGSELEFRTARMFAVVWMSGNLLKDAGYVPASFDVEALIRRQWAARAAEDRDDGRTVKERALKTLRQAILSAELTGMNGNVISDRRTGALLALWDEGLQAYCIPVDALPQLVGGILDKRVVSSALAEAGGLILPGDKSRNSHKSMPDGRRIPHLRVHVDFFKDPLDPEDPGYPFLKAVRDIEASWRKEQEERRRAGSTLH